MLRDIYLYGPLKEKFGEKYTLDVNSAKESVIALLHIVKGFSDEFFKYSYRIVIGDLEKEEDLEKNSFCEEELTLNLSKQNKIHIVPYIQGSKDAWIGVAIGIVIIAVAIVASGGTAAGSVGLLSGMGGTAFTIAGASITYGSIALIGVAMALGGIASLLAPDPSVGDYGARESVDRKPSFLFSGATNTIEQGGPVPVGFGKFLTGSVQISLGLRSEAV